MKTYKHTKRWELPGSYYGATWNGFFVAPVSHGRDSDILTDSNWETMTARFAALNGSAPFEPPPGALDDQGLEISSRFPVRENHWACGWVEWFAIHESDHAGLALAEEIGAALEGYPVLDESDFSEKEDAEAHRVWENCYSWRDRVHHIREHMSDFSGLSWSDLLANVRGEFYSGHPSSIVN